MNFNDDKYGGFKDSYKYPIGSKDYVDMVYEKYNLIPYEYMKPTKISDFSNPYVYQAYLLNAHIQSGNFMYEKNLNYKNNYITMMENMGVPQELINKVKKMTLKEFIGKSDMLPKMSTYYDYLKAIKKSHAGVSWDDAPDAVDDFVNNLNDSLGDLGYE